MSFFKKLFGIEKSDSHTSTETKKIEVNLSLDDAFVHHFIEKGGKFLYCTTSDEVIDSLSKIIEENKWNELICALPSLEGFVDSEKIKVITDLSQKKPIFTTCEHLIANKGDILFSSNQIKSYKLTDLSDNFIVYAKTSQFVQNIGQGLTGIKTNYLGNLPTNISAVKKYTISKNDDNFLNYGNNNAKNLYLLLFEDL